MVAALQVVGEQTQSTHRDAYNLYEAFEDAVAYHASNSGPFWTRIGHAIEPELLGKPVNKLIFQACHSINKSKGMPPESAVTVIQRLKLWSEEGRVTQKQIDEVVDLYEAVETAGVPSMESVLLELVPLIQKRMRAEAVRTALQEYTAKSDMQGVADLIQKASTLGESEESEGVFLMENTFELMEQARTTDYQRLGIPDLDAALSGGVGRGQLFVCVGGPGDGKSMLLSQAAVTAYLDGRNVAYATLELPEPLVVSRFKANLTNLPEKDIRKGMYSTEAKERMAEMMRWREANGMTSYLAVRYFTPHASTVQDVANWLREIEKKKGAKVDVLVVDYADMLFAKAGENEYLRMRAVYQALRVLAKDNGMWAVTASQSKADAPKKENNRGIWSMADSAHKARIADIVVTLNKGEEGITYFVAKHRTDAGQQTVGPIPTDFVYGRICPTGQ